MGLAPLFVPLAEQFRQRSAKPPRRVQLPHGTPIFLSSIGVERYTLVTVRKDLPSRNTGSDTQMLDHFPRLDLVCRQVLAPGHLSHGRSDGRVSGAVRWGVYQSVA
jgi:hypothetical protein